MDGDSEPLRDGNCNSKINSTASRRHVEVVRFSDTLLKMYHGILQYVMELYRDNRDCQYSWEHFRSAADRLAEMHKYAKLTILKVYELGIVEGAASFSSDFMEKIHDMQLQTGNENIPFDYLKQYLSRPGDPPPKSLRRIKRFAVRRRSQPVRNAREIVERYMNQNDINSQLSETASSSYAHRSKTLQWDTENKQSNWTVIQNTSSRICPDAETDCPSEDSWTSLSSCTCDDYLTDTSNSTNEDDEGESDPVAA
ncbi:unnamed protein product [Heterobilharzia americana]|nr:unnamed protein product [Heterobilharzia americana]CAH8471677.1 unnamed protein product [Heterobilharzia americana]